MLSLALTEALKGVDISRRYPQFYRQLLADEALREAFLQGLCLLEADAQNSLEPLPEPPSLDLRFLAQTRQSKPIIEMDSERSWRATWVQNDSQLQGPLRNLLFGKGHTPDSNSLTLIDAQIIVAHHPVAILLDLVTSPSATPDELRLGLLVTAAEQLFLRLTIHWGEYNVILPVPSGHTELPRLPLKAVLNGGQKDVQDSLLVVLESTTSPDVAVID